MTWIWHSIRSFRTEQSGLFLFTQFFPALLSTCWAPQRRGGLERLPPHLEQWVWPPRKGVKVAPPKSRKQKRRRERWGPARHSSRLMTCSLRVMMDKDFSRWDEIKIYTRCFRTQLVGRSSSFNSISAAGDGHPESGLSNGAVSWQNLHTDTRSQTHVGRKKRGKKHAFGTSGARRNSWGWAIDAGGRPNHRMQMRGTERERERERERDTYVLGHRQC